MTPQLKREGAVETGIVSCNIDFSELTLQSAVLDSLSANIAVLGPGGEILAVNRGWRDFADANNMKLSAAGVGANYLDVCRSASPDPNAREAREGIEGVMRGELSSFYHKYPCHGPSELSWFALRASPLVEHPNFVVVAHENITEQVLARISARPPRSGLPPIR